MRSIISNLGWYENPGAGQPTNAGAAKKIYGCIFSDQVAMNAALLRAGLFIHTDMGMASDAQLFNSKLMTAVGGHDFNGEELVKYQQHAVIPKRSTTTEHVQFKQIEQAFDQQVLKTIIKQNHDNFIFFAVINTKKFKENLSHELLHAQYYNTPQIAAILNKIWQDKVKPKDKETIITALRNGGYDMEQHELLLREFYSYFEQYNATEYLKSIKVLTGMADLANLYAPQISNALLKEQIKVLQIEY